MRGKKIRYRGRYRELFPVRLWKELSEVGLPIVFSTSHRVYPSFSEAISIEKRYFLRLERNS